MEEHHCNVCRLPFLIEIGMKIHASKMHNKNKNKNKTDLNDHMLYELCEVKGESNSTSQRILHGLQSYY